MKLKSLLRTVSLLFASSFLISFNSNAQEAKIPYIVLASDASLAINAADLSGFYLIKTADNSYFTPIQARTLYDFAQLCMKEKTWALQLIKDGEFYTINWGDKLANYEHSSNSGFGNVVTDRSKTLWAIEVVDGNQVKIKRSTGNNMYMYTKTVPSYMEGINLTQILSNGTGSEATLVTLVKVTEKIPAIIPTANTAIISETTTTLNNDDLTGKYVIQTSTSNFLSTEFDGIYSSAVGTGTYEFNFVKQTDNIYTISSGDLQANYLDFENLGFDAKINKYNTWKVLVTGNGSDVTIQTATDDFYLTNVPNETNNEVYNFRTYGTATDDVTFTLLKVLTNAVQQVTEEFKSNIYQSASQLIVTNSSNLKAIAIYNIKGQKVYNANVNSNSVLIPVESWNKGIYLVKLTDNSGNIRSVKTIVK